MAPIDQGPVSQSAKSSPMKAHLEPFSATLSSVLAMLVATGCWTSDANNHVSDAGVQDVNALCAPATAACFETIPMPADGVIVDIAHGTDSVTLLPAGISGGFYPFPGPDLDAGILNGISRRLAGDPLCPGPADPLYPYHVCGTVPGSAGWTMNWYLSATPPPTCTDPFKSTQGAILDASKFDGLTIQLFGNVGPTGQMTVAVASVGTPQDPTRQQELQTVINVPNSFTPTTYNFRWSELTAVCGSANYFQPSRIIGLRASVLALAGVAYPFDMVVGVIGFMPKSQ